MTLALPNPEQKQVVDHLCYTTEHTFITGKAGTGKTHVLRWFQRTTNKSIAICAPTGIAALNAGGSTIHNLVGLGASLPADQFVDIYKVKASRQWMAELDVLVIDEISMVSSDLLDAMDRVLREIREFDAPFGGLQVIMFGDVYQLPPVVTDDNKGFYKRHRYESEWFFDAHIWSETSFTTFELETVVRQSDEDFKTILNGVRDGSITPSELKQLNMVGSRRDRPDSVMLLGSRRKAVSDHNEQQLKLLKPRARLYEARVNKGFGRNEPAERKLRLKRGARIMMLSNDRGERWVNGTQGVIEYCGDDSIDVRLEDGTSQTIERNMWVPGGTPPEEFKLAPKFVQLPIKLAWGVTIHKSQGLSLKEIDVDLGSGAFSPGQTYVALSRVTSPQGLYLRGPITMKDIQVDPNVRRFFSNLRKEVAA